MTKCRHEFRAPDMVAKKWKCTQCHKEVQPFEGQEVIDDSPCDHKSWSSKISEKTLKKNGDYDFVWEKTCLECYESLPRDWGKRGVWPGDLNTDNIKEMQFQCQNYECDLPGGRILWANLEEPPEYIPYHAECPVCKGQMDFIPTLSLNGIVVGTNNPTYSRAAADSEHKWMELQIEESKKALKGKTGAAPYSKAKINYEYWEKQGVAKKTTFDEGEERKRLLVERNKAVASKSKDKIDKETTKEYVGRTKND